MSELPELCFVFRDGQLPGQKIAQVRRDETGFWPVHELPDATDGEAPESIRRANEALDVDRVQALQWVREHNLRVDANDRSGEGVRDVC